MRTTKKIVSTVLTVLMAMSSIILPMTSNKSETVFALEDPSLVPNGNLSAELNNYFVGNESNRPQYNTGDDYPARYKNAPIDSITDEWNFLNRECTSFVAWCLNTRNGVHFTNQYGGVYRWGDAKQWGGVASGLGIAVDSNPKVGSVAWSSDGTWGHVAWVKAVSGNSVTIEEYNFNWDWNHPGCFYSRTVDKSKFQYIHIKDIDMTPTPTPAPTPKGSKMGNGYNRELPDGDYIIANTGSSDKNVFWYLDPQGYDLPAANNTNVQLWSVDASNEATTDIDCDVWTITYANGFYSISQKDTYEYLDVVGTQDNGKYLERGSNIQMYSAYRPTQRWAISKNRGTNSGYRIQAECSGYSVDVSGGLLELRRNIQQWENNDTHAQSWMFIPYKPAQPIENGRYMLVSSIAPGWIMDVEGNSGDIADGTNVQLWSENAWNRWNSFDVTKLDNGYYKLIHAASGKALTVKDGSSTFGTNIALYSYNGSTYQQWAIKKTDYGYVLISRNSGMALDVLNGTLSSGTNIAEQAYTGAPNQSWTFVQAEYAVIYDCGYPYSEMVSGMPDNQIKYYRNDLTLALEEPKMDGYTFIGWKTDGYNDYDIYMPGDTYTFDEDVVLYARWQAEPTPMPTRVPTKMPTRQPTKRPTTAPTKMPTKAPTRVPTKSPTRMPTKSPTRMPTKSPTKMPTKVPTKAPTKKPTPTKAPVFSDFVERLYTCALNRKSEPEGKKYWTNEVTSGNRTGADCARYFLLEAPEFMNRNLSVEDFVETLYKTFFGRKSDVSGKKGWVNAIKKESKSRAEVVNDFIESTEWCNICARYSVKSGAMYQKATVASPKSIEFATRLYTSCLKRKADPNGVKYWSLALTNLEQTGCSAAKEFFCSSEFRSFDTSPKEYVRRLYKTFMGRNPEESGSSYWIRELNNGKERDDVLAAFAQSQEFSEICDKYGIDQGII